MDNSKLKYLLLYYLLLVLLFMSWTDIDSVPGSIERLAFLGTVLAPAYFFDKKLLPAVIVVFLNASTHGFTSSYMPAMMYTYVVILLLGLFLFSPENMKSKNSIINLLLILFLYTTLVNAITSFEIQGISQALIISLCLLCYIDFENEQHLHIMSCAFMIAAIILSYSLLIWGIDINVDNTYGEERYGFQDINYSACVVSLGCIAALVELFYNSKNKFILIICIATLVISTVALALNASRASFLAILVVFLILSTISKSRLIYKVLIIGLFLVGIWYLYTNDYFALLETRIEMDSDGGGSGRVEIWNIKLDAFFNDSNILQFLFGWGYTEGRELAMNKLWTLGFHNDYLAFLVEYGVVGGLMFLCMFFYPLWCALRNHNNFIIVGAMSIGFFVICSTLEPFAAGRVPYYFFWLLMLWWAKLKPTESQEIIN